MNIHIYPSCLFSVLTLQHPASFAEQQEIERLYAAALRVSKARFKEVIEEEGFKLMPFDKVYELISADDLNVDEEKVKKTWYYYYLY